MQVLNNAELESVSGGKGGGKSARELWRLFINLFKRTPTTQEVDSIENTAITHSARCDSKGPEEIGLAHWHYHNSTKL